MKKGFVLMAALGLVLTGALAMAAPAKRAQAKPAEAKFEGDIVSVNVKEDNFTVKGMEQGKPAEMTFHVSKGTKIMIDAEEKVLGELQKGDHVTVTYETKEGKHMVKHVQRHKKATE